MYKKTLYVSHTKIQASIYTDATIYYLIISDPYKIAIHVRTEIIVMIPTTVTII